MFRELATADDKKADNLNKEARSLAKQAAELEQQMNVHIQQAAELNQSSSRAIEAGKQYYRNGDIARAEAFKKQGKDNLTSARQYTEIATQLFQSMETLREQSSDRQREGQNMRDTAALWRKFADTEIVNAPMCQLTVDVGCWVVGCCSGSGVLRR
ncbi:hypothetical protein [Streptomyces flaveolus]|uniref:hypothetical protein n=1 Tax=Streptomyces flaveolus TaxID=67297 RepID=UPI0033DEBC06